MQERDWDGLKYLLVLQRAGSLSEAGRRLGVSETTVARRLKRLQASLGIPLFTRAARGGFEPTDPARAALGHAEAAERAVFAFYEQLGQISAEIAGTVRISTVPAILHHILVPSLGALRATHPELTVELVPETRNIDLTRREADLAIRFSRPVQGGLATRARKLGALQFGLYCAAEIAPGEDHRLDWIGYDDSAASLPQAIWTEALRRQSGGRASALRVTDIETALAASVAGHGKAVLPRVMCLADDRLRALPAPEPRQEMARDVWLLSHADQTANLSIEAAKTWLTGLEWR